MIARRWDARAGQEVGNSMKHSDVYAGPILDLVTSTNCKLIVVGQRASLERWDARSKEQIGDYIKVPGLAGNIMISNNGEAIACGSEYYGYLRKWETNSGKCVCRAINWSEVVQILDEMERARQSGSQECDVFARKNIFPIEARFASVSPEQKKCFGLDNGSVAILERRQPNF